jgi:hypothetical protein
MRKLAIGKDSISGKKRFKMYLINLPFDDSVLNRSFRYRNITTRLNGI